MKSIVRHTLLSMLAFIACMFIFPSCSDDNEMEGLRGQWQIMSIEYPAGRTVVLQSPRLYISFDRDLLQLTSSDDLEGFNPRYIGQVTGQVPDLTFSFPAYLGLDKISIISRWGIDRDPVPVKVESLKGSTMILKVDENILTLRKF